MSSNDMTEAEQTLADDRVRAEIANLNALTSKLAAETSKINKENQWYVAVVASGATLAIVAIVKLFM